MRTVVESMLPATFLVRYAIYMQSCAHIELASWHIVQLAQGYELYTPARIEHFLKVKMSTSKLVEALRRSNSYGPVGIQLRIRLAAIRVKQGMTNRNLAAHGAWFHNDGKGALSVEHYFQQRVGDAKQWMHVDENISHRQIDEAVEEADLLLRELIDIREELKRYQKSTRSRLEFASAVTAPRTSK
ncbi:hypothetical protein [Roseovarius sp. Pro17]|uniref:hypothetical protein n=1 Tax=Roseovarius sp. Pro17 TaxID=3108175 RepID=UPI002D784556|nr:hypothetical protein [Roseovarius sp. Pro17]